MRITQNIHFISNEDRKISYKRNSLEILPHPNGPLVIMLTWLMATDKHIHKYSSFYLNYGFAVLNIRIDLWQLLWPVKGAQVLAAEILKFLENNKNCRPFVVHGFSVGCYLWGEVLVQIKSNKSRYQFVIDNIVGQIWDSPADITRIPFGVAYATFPRNQYLQNMLKSYATYHLEIFEKEATTHYINSREMLFDNIVRTPVLVLASKIDPISSEDTINGICEYWKENGLRVDLKIWDDSPHVGHMHMYPKEYNRELIFYLEYINLIPKNNLKANL